MNRRDVVFALVALGAVPHAAEAQIAANIPVIGLLDAGGDRLDWWTAFRQQLRELGYIEGRNVALEARYASGKYELLPALAQELVRLKASVIVTGGTVAAQAAKRATSTIPIVMATGIDPVSVGLATSLARPGGNVTGVISISSELTGKRFELLGQVLPKMSRLAVLWHRDNPASGVAVRDLESAARSSKVTLQNLGIKSADEFAGAFSAMRQERAQAVFVVASPLFSTERRRIAELALKHQLPSVVGTSQLVEAGGLMGYAPNYQKLFRKAAVYVDKILKGAKPAELPIEQPTELELVVNMKTARALGITIPNSILLRADRVIE